MCVARKCLLLYLAMASVLDVQVQVSAQTCESGDELVDSILRLVRPKYKPPMKPMELGNRTIGINERVGLVQVIAILRIKRGFVNHVGGLERVGEAFYTEYEDDSTKIEMRLGIFDIKFNATIEMEFMGIRQREVVSGSVEFFGTSFEVLTNATTGERHVDNVSVFEMSGLKLKFSGPHDIINRVQNIPMKVGVRLIMNSNLKSIVYAIVSVAVSDSLATIAGAA